MDILIQERHNPSENCIKVKVSRRTLKVEIYLANEASGLGFCSTDLGHVFGSSVANEFGVMLRGNGPHKPEFAYDIVRIHSLMIYTDLIEYNIVADTKGSIAALLSLYFEAQVWRHYNYWTVHELSDIWQPAFQTAAQKFKREVAYARQGGSRKRSSSRVIPPKSAKQISRSRRDIFTNISP